MNWKRTLLFSCLAQCCGVLCFVGIRNLGLPYLLKSIDFTDSNTLLLMSFLSLNAVFQLIASILFSGRDIKKLLIGNFLIAHGILGFCCLAYLYLNWSPIICVIGVFLYFLFTAIGDTFWWPFIHPQIAEKETGAFFTRLRIVWASFSFLGVLCLTGLANKLSLTRDFALFIFFIGLLGALRTLFLVPMNIDTSNKVDKRVSLKEILSMLHSFIREKEFQFIFIFVFFEPLFGPSLILFLNNKGISPGDNFLIQGIALVSTIFSLLYMNRKLEKVGEERVIHALQFPFLVLIFLLSLLGFLEGEKMVVFLAICLKFCAGVISAALHLIYIKRLFRFIPTDMKAVSMASANVLIFCILFFSEAIFSQGLKILGSNSYTKVYMVFFVFALTLHLISVKRSNVKNIVRQY